MPSTSDLATAVRGPPRCVSAVKVGDIIWTEDATEGQLVKYITEFSGSLVELTLENAAGVESKVTYNATLEVGCQEAPTVAELLKNKDPNQITVSFEYFPPKTEKGVENLMNRIGLMRKADPIFCDVTWGAGGGTSDLTLELCTNAQIKWGVNANMHLTCTNMEKEKIDMALEGCKKVGIRNIVALRGDPPVGQTEWKAIDTGFSCALDLVKYIREKHVAGYPEGHPTVIADDGKCPPEAFAGEMAYLKEKVVAGIMIITSYGGFKKMAGFCKTWIPADLASKMEEIKDDEAAVKEFGVQYAVDMCKKLIDAGHKHLHFYCLNVEGPTFAVMERLSSQLRTHSGGGNKG